MAEIEKFNLVATNEEDEEENINEDEDELRDDITTEGDHVLVRQKTSLSQRNFEQYLMRGSSKNMDFERYLNRNSSLDVAS